MVELINTRLKKYQVKLFNYQIVPITVIAGDVVGEGIFNLIFALIRLDGRPEILEDTLRFDLGCIETKEREFNRSGYF